MSINFLQSMVLYKVKVNCLGHRLDERDFKNQKYQAFSVLQ